MLCVLFATLCAVCADGATTAVAGGGPGDGGGGPPGGGHDDGRWRTKCDLIALSSTAVLILVILRLFVGQLCCAFVYVCDNKHLRGPFRQEEQEGQERKG